MKKFSETTKIKICFVAAASDGQQQCSDKIISGETYCLNIKSRQTKPHIYIAWIWIWLRSSRIISTYLPHHVLGDHQRQQEGPLLHAGTARIYFTNFCLRSCYLHLASGGLPASCPLMTSRNPPQPASSCMVLLYFFYNMYVATYTSWSLLICSLVLTFFEEIGLAAAVEAGHDNLGTDDIAAAFEGPLAEAKIYNYNYKLPRIRHIRGKYKHKEEIIKKVEHDHPCKLTETAVKVMY